MILVYTYCNIIKLRERETICQGSAQTIGTISFFLFLESLSLSLSLSVTHTMDALLRILLNEEIKNNNITIV